jgi:23S rRNA pseudouridine2605 synthase
MADERMRVHRALALAGVASRRAAETMVADGRVTVNGAPAAVGQLVSPGDRLAVDGAVVRGSEPRRAYLLNKPAGVVSTASDGPRCSTRCPTTCGSTRSAASTSTPPAPS